MKMMSKFVEGCTKVFGIYIPFGATKLGPFHTYKHLYPSPIYQVILGNYPVESQVLPQPHWSSLVQCSLDYQTSPTQSNLFCNTRRLPCCVYTLPSCKHTLTVKTNIRLGLKCLRVSNGLAYSIFQSKHVQNWPRGQCYKTFFVRD